MHQQVTSLLTLPDMQWEQRPKLVQPAALAEAVCIKNHMYIFYFNGVSCLNLNTKVWSACPDMPAKNTVPIIAAIGEKVYMIPDTDWNKECRTSTKEEWYSCRGLALANNGI